MAQIPSCFLPIFWVSWFHSHVFYLFRGLISAPCLPETQLHVHPVPSVPSVPSPFGIEFLSTNHFSSFHYVPFIIFIPNWSFDLSDLVSWHVTGRHVVGCLWFKSLYLLTTSLWILWRMYLRGFPKSVNLWKSFDPSCVPSKLQDAETPSEYQV